MPRRAIPSEDEPWWFVVRPDDADIRYHRALRLSKFRREVARGPGVLMHAGKIRYRQACLKNWQDYLNGWTPESDGL